MVYNRQVALYPEVHKKTSRWHNSLQEHQAAQQAADNFVTRVPPAQNMWGKLAEHDVSHILSTEEEFLIFHERIDM